MMAKTMITQEMHYLLIIFPWISEATCVVKNDNTCIWPFSGNGFVTRLLFMMFNTKLSLHIWAGKNNHLHLMSLYILGRTYQ